MKINIVKLSNLKRFTTWSGSFYTSKGFFELGEKNSDEILEITEKSLKEANDYTISKILKFLKNRSIYTHDYDVEKMVGSTLSQKIISCIEKRDISNQELNFSEKLTSSIVIYGVLSIFLDKRYNQENINDAVEKMKSLEAELQKVKEYLESVDYDGEY